MSLKFLIASVFLPSLLFAQSYNTAGGIRLGTEWGLTLKQRIANHTTVEGIFQKGFNEDETIVTLLANQHFPLITRRFNLYFGGGLHKGWNTSEDVIYEDPFGISLVGGLEFTVGRLNLSWDFKPAFNLSGGTKDFYSHTGLSLRYVFWKRESSMRKWFKERKWEFWKKKTDK